MNDDIQNKRKIEHYLRREDLFRDFSQLCELTKQRELSLKILNLGIKFLTPYNKLLFSKDTNDLVTMFNSDDGFLEYLYYRKAKLYRNYDNTEYVNILNTITNKFNFIESNKYNKYTIKNTLLDLYKYYLENENLDSAKFQFIRLHNVDSYLAKSNYNLLNNYFKNRNIDTIDYLKFLEENKILVNDYKKVPKNITLTTNIGKFALDLIKDSVIIVLNINDRCQRCNEKIPMLIDSLYKNNQNIVVIAITDLSPKIISDYIGFELKTIKKSDLVVKDLGIDVYKDSDRLIVISKGRIRIEDDFIDYNQFVDKYLN